MGFDGTCIDSHNNSIGKIMQVDAEEYDKALHEIPVFVQRLEALVATLKQLEKDIMQFRQHLIKSVKDEEDKPC